MQFQTKSKTLETLRSSLKNAKVLPVFSFDVHSWNDNSKNILNDILEKAWASKPVVVRSSAIAEDSTSESLAGHFESILNVSGKNEIKEAINDVIASYTDNNPSNEVFIQPMLEDVQKSGVLFTRDPSNSSHYYVINYDESSGKTDTVTAGTSDELKTLYIVKTVNAEEKSWANELILLAKELEVLFTCDHLDIEFAFNKKNELFLFQVRPLVLKKTSSIDLEKQRVIIRQIKNKVISLSKPFPYLAGKKSILGLMPDWNPAEIIGVRPRPLALSLYKEFITDAVWSESRSRYGYRNLRGFPLLINLGGIPYIDVRVSFNSFVPEDINDKLASKLIEYYITSLENDPQNHDKVEFEVIFSCYTFDIEKRLKNLLDKGFTKDEIKEIESSLRNLTNSIMHTEKGLWHSDLEKIHTLIKKQKIILESDLNEIEKIYWLIEDCKRYGTLPFAGLARAGFVAVLILKSLVAEGYLTDADYHTFLNSLEAINSQMNSDLSNTDKINFLDKYGHLRPGTYDILSDRYDETPDKYFSFQKGSSKSVDIEKPSFELSLDKISKIRELIKEHGFKHDVIDLFNFLKGAIEGREFAKFVFSKSLSESIKLLEQLGHRFNFSKEDVSFSDISIIKRLYSSTDRFNPTMNSSIKMGKRRYERITQNITLPPLIVTPRNVEVFELPEEEPNYITLKKTTSKVVSTSAKKELKGNILMIPSADPGFDWIFTHQISGFITMFGGVNSHMAIRAQELGIPAVIGAGELLYKRWQEAEVLTIDCANKMVQIIK
jgi:glutamine kinase